MGTCQIMKKIFVMLFLASSIYSQSVGYAEAGHRIYIFLERMYITGNLSNLDEQHKPYSYRYINICLAEIEKSEVKLNDTDRNLLEEYLAEFSFVREKSTERFVSFSNEPSLKTLVSEKEKYLYFNADTSGNGIFVNFLWNNSFMGENNSSGSYSGNVWTADWGGRISGSYKNFGFRISATNGTSFGNDAVLLNDPEYRANYKFNEVSDNNSGSNYFDETEGYAVYQNDDLSFKIGRDRNEIGFGKFKSILSRQSLKMDYFGINYKYSLFSFSYLHGKLLGSMKTTSDSVEGNLVDVTEKYFVYHRFGFDFSEYFKFGAGEMIIYSRRSLDLSYLNPFNFYKSIEHDNRDRDNSMLFFDFKSKPVDGISLYGEFLIDDIDFSKIGTGWYGNKTLFNLGAILIPFYKSFPVEFNLQMIRIEPYVYVHRILDNNYSNLGLSLVYPLEPNSLNYSFSAFHQVNEKLSFDAGYFISLHGENIYSDTGELLENYGGNISDGHRPGDPDNAKFLDGEKSTKQVISFSADYQLIRNYFLSLKINYESEKKGPVKNNRVLSALILSIKI